MANRRLPHLPDEILTEIFLKLPSKSVGKCRCLSKPWRSRLSSSQFIKLHLNHSKTNQENLILISETSRSLHTVAPPITDGSVSKELLELGSSWTRVLGSCNGLILLENHDLQIFVVNPTTQDKVCIPYSNSNVKLDNGTSLVYRNMSQFIRLFGFGYDTVTDDYKIVRVSHCHDLNAPDSRYELVEVFSLKLGVWRSIHTSPPRSDISGMTSRCAAFVNGAIHWRSWRRSLHSCIIALNLVDGTVREIPLPSKMRSSDGDGHRCYRLLVIKGCLSIVTTERESGRLNGCVLWVMEEYGCVSSWKKYTFGRKNYFNVMSPLYFAGDKEVVLMREGGYGGKGVVVHHLEKETTRELAIDGRMDYFVKAFTFVDSLVSPSLMNICS